MTRRLDPDLLQRLSEERHRLVSSGSFGQNYAAAVDAYRLAQEAQVKDAASEREGPNSGFDTKRDYRELE